MVTAGDDGEPEPRSSRLRRVMARSQPPDNELPGSLALDRILARTEDLAVVLVGGRLYSAGIALDLLVVERQADVDFDVDADTAHADDDDALAEQAFADVASSAGGTALLLGVEYPDGRRTTNLRSGRHTFAEFGEADDQRLHLSSQGGGSGGGRVRMGFWLTPPPPAGDLLVVCAWPHRGIAETRTVIAASDLDRARSHRSELWPCEPEPERQRQQPPAQPVLPPGWFTEAWDDEVGP